jgi:hypothetical protein
MSDVSANVSYQHLPRVCFKVIFILDEFGIVFIIFYHQKRHFDNFNVFTTVETRSGSLNLPALSFPSHPYSPPSTIFTSLAWKCKPESFHAFATIYVYILMRSNRFHTHPHRRSSARLATSALASGMCGVNIFQGCFFQLNSRHNNSSRVYIDAACPAFDLM